MDPHTKALLIEAAQGLEDALCLAGHGRETDADIRNYVAQPHVQAMWAHLTPERLLDNARRWFTAWQR